MAPRGSVIWTGLPSRMISPPTVRSMPKMARASSVRPEPTSPARPRISPARRARLTVWVGKAVVRTSFEVQRHLARRAGRRDVERFQVPADHQADHLVVLDLALGQVADHLAVAQDQHAVGAALHLLQAVRDVDDADAVGLQIGDDAEQARGLAGGQAGGRLVHDHQAGVQRQRLGDLHQLALGEGKVGHRRRRPEIGAQAGEEGLHLLMQHAGVDQLQRPAEARLAPDEDVGGDVEVVEQVEFLMHEGDAGLGGILDGQGGPLGAVDPDGARARRDHAAEDLHEGGFAGAVLADQADDLTRRDRQADAGQGDDPGIGLADVLKLEEGRGDRRLLR